MIRKSSVAPPPSPHSVCQPHAQIPHVFWRRLSFSSISCSGETVLSSRSLCIVRPSSLLQYPFSTLRGHTELFFTPRPFSMTSSITHSLPFTTRRPTLQPSPSSDIVQDVSVKRQDGKSDVSIVQGEQKALCTYETSRQSKQCLSMHVLLCLTSLLHLDRETQSCSWPEETNTCFR